MVSALDSGSKGPGSIPDRVIVFRGRTLHSYSASLHPANCQGNQTKCWEVTCDGLASHPGGIPLLLVASCCQNPDIISYDSNRPLGS